MTPEEELELVRKAILLGQTVTGCFEWYDGAVRRVERDPDLRELSADEIRLLVIEFVLAGGIIRQAKERRPEYGDYEFYYKAILPVPDFPQELFVEMRVVDPEPECPTVLIVNAHPQRQ